MFKITNKIKAGKIIMKIKKFFKLENVNDKAKIAKVANTISIAINKLKLNIAKQKVKNAEVIILLTNKPIK